jgi:DNA-binding XRE family transcriptional regulator
MKAAKRRRLEAAGWRVGTVKEFLRLSDQETMLVELKLALSDSLKRHRQQAGLTQAGLAKILGSSQSRVAKIEAAEPGITLDLLFRALLAIGVTAEQIARDFPKKKRLARAS